MYQVNRRVWLRVPPGVSEGQVLKVAGQGDAGQYGGAAGNLYVKLQVRGNAGGEGGMQGGRVDTWHRVFTCERLPPVMEECGR